MVKALKLLAVTRAPSLLNSNCVLIVFLKQKVLGERFLLFSLKCVLSCNLKHEGRFVGHPPPPRLVIGLWWRSVRGPSWSAEFLAP